MIHPATLDVIAEFSIINDVHPFFLVMVIALALILISKFVLP